MRTDARLIAATNSDLFAMVGEHKFRSDLFYRLNVFPIHVPALRERPEDIPLLVRYFAELFSRRMKKSIESIPAETMTALTAYDWPGNVRELQNVIERAVILSRHGVLRIPAADLKISKSASPVNGESTTLTSKRTRASIPALSREQVVEALKEARGRVGGADGAAARLGLKRTTLIAQMKKLGVNPRTVISEP
jgi:formate hydrogenlyase transcriptional activator